MSYDAGDASATRGQHQSPLLRPAQFVPAESSRARGEPAISNRHPLRSTPEVASALDTLIAAGVIVNLGLLCREERLKQLEVELNAPLPPPSTGRIPESNVSDFFLFVFVFFSIDSSSSAWGWCGIRYRAVSARSLSFTSNVSMPFSCKGRRLLLAKTRFFSLSQNR